MGDSQLASFMRQNMTLPATQISAYFGADLLETSSILTEGKLSNQIGSRRIMPRLIANRRCPYCPGDCLNNFNGLVVIAAGLCRD